MFYLLKKVRDISRVHTQIHYPSETKKKVIHAHEVYKTKWLIIEY